MPSIRLAAPGDEAAVAGVHVRSWQSGYRGLLPDAYLEALRPEDRARRYTFADTDPLKPITLMALADGAIRGFATLSPCLDAEGAGKGELSGLYVDPEHWSLGIGTALLIAARTHLVLRRFDSAVLWVLAGNARAQRFYAKDGWRADGIERSQEIWGITVQESRYSRRLP